MSSVASNGSHATLGSRPRSAQLALVAPATERRHRPPRLQKGMLPRDRLLRRLVQSADIPLVLVVAPVGYGKTTLLAEWAERDVHRVAWLSLDETDDDPRRLAASIALALYEGARELTNGNSHRVPLDAGNVLGRERPFLLVLDDVHHLRSAATLDALAVIADSVPDGSQLVLASREEPALPIGRLRAHGKLMDIRARDLAMTRREATAMLSLAGLDLRPEDVQVLLQRTEGWPAGLYLAALSLRERPDADRAVASFSGDDRLISDYLRDELLDGLESDQRAFLQSTSVLDQLSGPLCDAVLRNTGSGRVLRDLSRSNVLLMPTDGADANYRYHALLARMLQAELHRVDPRFEAELHGRASTWYADAGDPDRAIAHAVQAADTQRAGDLLWSTAAEYVLGGRDAKIRHWLDQFTGEQVGGHATLALTAAARHLAIGDRDLMEHWASAAESLLGEEALPELEAGVAVMRAAVARDGIGAMAADAERAYELAAQDSPWRSLCCLLRGVADHLRGDPEQARLHLEEGARRGTIAAPSIQVLCLAQLALIALEQGDWQLGPLLAARARAQVERVGLRDYPGCALVFAVSALVRSHQDRVEDAQADRRQAAALLALPADSVPWYEVETGVVLGRAALRLGDVPDTRALLAKASRALARAEDAVLLREWVDDLRSRIEAFTVTELVGPSSLTTAELRVLGLLPTHLSFREMGRRLHVSANTIKTHAHAVYRKLDVCSRSDAVIRARHIGLLDAEA